MANKAATINAYVNELRCRLTALPIIIMDAEEKKLNWVGKWLDESMRN